MTTSLQTIDVLPEINHQYSIIWMHGLGADGHDFEAIVPELDLPDNHKTGFIFPHAPIQPVTINGGMEMRSWYDILEMSLERKVDITGIYQSSSAIESLIQQEVDRGIPTDNIMLAGFSQGGVIALQTALKAQYKLAGIMALSTYLPTLNEITNDASQENSNIPIFMAHGNIDPVVDMQMGLQVFHQLKALNYPISWHEYHMQHSVCQQEIVDISHFIKSVFQLG